MLTLEMAYKMGTSDISASGVVWTPNGLGVGGGGGTSESLLAQSIAPPKRASSILWVLLILAVVGATLAILQDNWGPQPYFGRDFEQNPIGFAFEGTFYGWWYTPYEVLTGDEQMVGGKLLCLIIWGSGACLAYALVKHASLWNKTIFPVLLHHWKQTWLCPQCGFQQEVRNAPTRATTTAAWRQDARPAVPTDDLRFEFQCENCMESYVTVRRRIGEIVVCPACKHSIKIGGEQ
jgi:hypothetical protein